MILNQKKIGIIFGAAGDIGKSFISELNKGNEFDELILVYRSTKPELIDNNYLKLTYIKYGYPSNCDELEKAIRELDRPLDFIINTIGYYSETSDKFNIDAFNLVLEQNLGVLLHITKILRPHLKSGTIFINISSIASDLESEKEFAYGAVKKIIDRFIKLLRADYYYNKCTILNIKPGAVISRITKSRDNSLSLIDPKELASSCIKIATLGNSLMVSEVNIYKKNIQK